MHFTAQPRYSSYIVKEFAAYKMQPIFLNDKKITQPLGHMYDNKMLKRNKITKYFVKTLEKLYNFFPFKIVHTDKHFP